MGEELTRPEWSTRWNALRSDRRLAAAVLTCLALAAGIAWWRAGASSSAALPPVPPTTATVARPGPRATTSTVAVTELVVDVVGAVRRNGIVRLRTGARVIDAIAAAGGASADADLTRVNLAAVLTDGSRLAVPRAGAPPPVVDPGSVSAPTPGTGPEASGPVDLNTATAQQLDALPGIGPAIAAAIVRDREAHGPFTSVDDLTRVRGIGPTKLAQLRDLVTV